MEEPEFLKELRQSTAVTRVKHRRTLDSAEPTKGTRWARRHEIWDSDVVDLEGLFLVFALTPPFLRVAHGAGAEPCEPQQSAEP